MMINFRKRNRKTGHDYYSMDSFACGFKTRSRVEGQPASHFLTAHAHSVRVARCRQTGTLPGCPVNAQRNSVIISDVLLISFPKLLTTFPKTKRRTDFFQAYHFRYTKKKSIRLNLFAIILFQNITCLFFPLPILLTMKRSVGSGQKYRRGTDCCFQSSTGSVKNKSVQTCRTATGLRKFAERRCTTSISLIHF